MNDALLNLNDGAHGPAEWAYLLSVYGIGVGLFVAMLVFAYRSLFMDVWSARIDYVLLHCSFGALVSVCMVTCFWPGLRQTFVFTLVRLLVLIVSALYLSVTHRQGMPYHVPGYQRKPPQPEPESAEAWKESRHG